MDRRRFIAASGSLGLASVAGAQTTPAAPSNLIPPPITPRDTSTAGNVHATACSAPGPIFTGHPVVCGPAPESISILHPVQRHATGYLEFAVEDGPWQRVDAGAAGLLPLEPFALKFRLPPLPAGKTIRYRITGRSIGWVQVREFYHGEIIAGDAETTPVHTFRTLDPAAETTRFIVWNDTHENAETLKKLHALTAAAKPDFLLWNGDQSNDVHYEQSMPGQFLNPAGLSIGDWPLAYARGNHDVRGPEARLLPRYTGTPDDRFYYAFRSGPLAALVMDTGEDKPDDSSYFAGMFAFQKLQAQQAEWLKGVVNEPWFRDAKYKILFCHIPLWFTRDIFPVHQRWEFTPVCRDLWLPTLEAAGVKLVVSGHTHDWRWMPAKEGQPLGQLIGGGPVARYATYIEGHATPEKLTLTMSSLAGDKLAEVAIPA
jgi:hypothetical protein